MAPILEADLEAIRQLAAELVASAGVIRGIDFDAVFAAIGSGLPGSDIATACTSAPTQIEDALGTVADRIDALAAANTDAATRLGTTEADYAAAIADTMKR